MAYKMSDTNWKFTAPQAGEVDSAENKAATLKEIDEAIISPDERAQLTGKGEQSSKITDQTYKLDSYLTKQRNKNTYVTEKHFHPTPTSVPKADKATEADHAKKADSATSASKLNPGKKINGHLFDGTKDITIKRDDIPDVNRVFYGTADPSKYSGFPKTLRNGDIYVKIHS